MKFLSIEAFVPSGSNFEGSKQLFLELGFSINWDQGDYIGFQKDECRFILQHFNMPQFAQNFMLSVKVTNVTGFRDMIIEKRLAAKYGIRINDIVQQPYGKELNMIDIAGVCWHFVEQ
ncbi:MAG: hypothetical protein ABI367_05050 [Mucilaginibacter sp.]